MTHSDQLHYFRDAFETVQDLVAVQIMKSDQAAADYSYYS